MTHIRVRLQSDLGEHLVRVRLGLQSRAEQGRAEARERELLHTVAAKLRQQNY